MEEKKPFGQSIDDAIKGGIRNIYENESAQAFGRGLINNPLSKGIMQYVVDPVAELGTRAASAKGILPFLPESSLLSLLTPEVTMDRQTRESIDEDLIPYGPRPEGMSAMDVLGIHMDRARADIGALGEFIFGDVRKAGESLNKGVKFADLPPEQKMASRFFLLDILPIPGVPPAAKAGQIATKELENLQALKSRMVTSDGSVGAGDVEAMLTENIKNTVGNISDDELKYLSSFYGDLPIEAKNKVFNLLNKDEIEKFNSFFKKPGQVFKPAADLVIANNYYTKKNEDIASILLSDPDKYFYKTPRTTDYASERMIKSIGGRAKTLGIEMKGSNKAATLRYGTETNYKGTLEKFNEKLKAGNIDIEDNKSLYDAFTSSYEEATGKKALSTGVGSKPFFRVLDRYNAENDIFIPRKSEIRKQELDETRQKFGTIKSEDIFRQYYKNNYQNILKKEKENKVINSSTNLADIGTSSPSFRYLNFIRKTETPELMNNPEAFIQKYNPNELDTPGTKTYEDFQRFKIIDDARKQANILLKDVLKKIYPAEKGKKSKASLQVAHKFESSGIAKGYVDPSKLGKGGDPFEIYLDVSQFNSIEQQKIEKLLRQAVKGYMNDGNKSDLNKILSYHNLMKGKGIEGQAYPFIVGKPKSIDLKLSELIQKSMDRGIEFTDEELANAEKALDYIATSKQKYKLEFGEDLDYAQGGLVEPVKASTGGFFSRLFGKAKFREEGMDVPDIYNPTAAQRTKLEELYPGMAFPEKIDGQVYYSNLDTALRKQNAPQVFNTQKELTDYFNASGVGVDEVYDAKLDAYIKAKTDRGLPLLSNEMLQISNESPLREVYFDAYGFRSDKYNKSNTYKETNYDQGLNSGFVPNTYRERVLRIPYTALRGDPGQSPGVGSHTFGSQYGDQRDNYMIAWSRQTDRPAFILPGETVDAQSGKIVSPKGVADKTKLQNIENKIQKLGQDPIATLNIVDDVFDARDTQAVMTAVKDLVEKSNGRINNNRAMQIILGQAKEKKKQIKKLQTQYNEEAQRIDDFKPAKKQEVTATVVEELQSDLSQAATKKARDLALKLKVMADQNIPLESMKDNELLTYFQLTKDTGGYGVSRPVGASRLELQSQYDQLMDLQRELTALSRQRPYQMNAEQINFYRDKVKGQQTAIIDTMVEAISKDLMSQLYADVPLKNRLQWADAVFKQAVAEAWHRKFVEKDPNAPSFIGIQSGDNRRNMWTQDGSTATSVEDRARDKASRIENFTNAVASGRDASLERTQYPGVGTDEFYGGPLTVTPEGTHYTGVGESIMKKLANDYNSRVVILNSATSNPTSTNYFKIINQDTGADVGMGDTYRQAENIANDLVDKEGGRYKIERATEKVYDTEPIFGIELTPEMGQLFKIYK